MIKTVFLPAQPFYRIGEAEGVYAARAARGLILKKAGRWFGRYERGETVYAVTCIETGEKEAAYWDTIYDYIDLKMQEWEG